MQLEANRVAQEEADKVLFSKNFAPKAGYFLEWGSLSDSGVGC